MHNGVVSSRRRQLLLERLQDVQNRHHVDHAQPGPFLAGDVALEGYGTLRPRHECNVRPQGERLNGNLAPQAPRRTVADVAHRIDVGPGRAAGYQYALSGQVPPHG